MSARWRQIAPLRSEGESGDAAVPPEMRTILKAHERWNGALVGGRRRLLAKIAAYVDMGFDPAKLLRAVHRDTRFLRSDTQRVMENVRCLRSFGFKNGEIGEMLLGAPWTLRSDTQKLADFLTYFHQSLRLPKRGVAHLCARDPRVASLHLEKTIRPCTDFFVKDLGMDRTRFVEMIEKYPRILHIPLETRIRPIVRYFLYDVKIPKEPFLFHLRSFPGVLGTSLEKSVRFRVQWLAEVTRADARVMPFVCLRGLVLFQTRSTILFRSYDVLSQAADGDVHLMGRILRRVPHILFWSPATLARQLTFVRERLGRRLEDLYHFPSLLGLSIRGSILPRLRCLERLGVRHEQYPLFLLFGSTDLHFREWLESVRGKVRRLHREQERSAVEGSLGLEHAPLRLKPANERISLHDVTGDLLPGRRESIGN